MADFAVPKLPESTKKSAKSVTPEPLKSPPAQPAKLEKLRESAREVGEVDRTIKIRISKLCVHQHFNPKSSILIIGETTVVQIETLQSRKNGIATQVSPRKRPVHP